MVTGLVARSAFRGVVERVRELRVTSGALTMPWQRLLAWD
ncbi:MAG: hypothetical protein CM1200mP24_07490 [Gammaproteobacteria bacterium]|nr:MAG: hypothetical protein CM1200mP24_07490 [Gammaproteobacteria bacterium]